MMQATRRTAGSSRFRLRWLLWALALCSIILAACGYYLRSVHRQVRGRTQIRQAGGQVFFSFQTKAEALDRAAKPWLPRWGKKVLPVEYLYSVTYVEFRGAGCGDPQLKLLKTTPWVEWLDLRESAVTEAGLAELARLLPNLKRLDLGETNIGDGAVEHLQLLKSLDWLRLEHTQFTASGIQKLAAGLPNCRIDLGVPPMHED